jgi:hypothetical protein
MSDGFTETLDRMQAFYGALARDGAMVDRRGAGLDAVIAETGGHLAEIGPEPLERVPRPCPPDHPRADLLRRKSPAQGMPLPDGWRDGGEGPVAALRDRFARLMPFRDFLAMRL